MGAKKKGLANKLAKMSDEDRARYLQHRADMEEEARRRKEQLISIFLKNKLKKEEAFSRLNVAKINQNWHQIMRKQKCKGMKEDVEFMRQHMDRTLQLKDRMIQRLILELDEADQQYSNNFQSHLSHVTDMIDFGYKSLYEMHETYDKDRAEILEVARKERREFMKKASEETTYLKTVIYQQDFGSKKTLRDNYEFYFKKSDDVIRQNKEIFEAMRHEKESALSDLWRSIADFIHGHVEVSDVKRAHLAELQSLDAESAAEIARHEEAIKRQEEEIVVLETQLEDLKNSRTDEIDELEKTARNVKREHIEAKIQLKKELDSDERQLILLAQTSNNTITYLENLKEKGEKLLELAQICRKYETQEEKILRFTGDQHGLHKYTSLDNSNDDNGKKPSKSSDSKQELSSVFDERVSYSKTESLARFQKVSNDSNENTSKINGGALQSYSTEDSSTEMNRIIFTEVQTSYIEEEGECGKVQSYSEDYSGSKSIKESCSEAVNFEGDSSIESPIEEGTVSSRHIQQKLGSSGDDENVMKEESSAQTEGGTADIIGGEESLKLIEEISRSYDERKISRVKSNDDKVAPSTSKAQTRKITIENKDLSSPSSKAQISSKEAAEEERLKFTLSSYCEDTVEEISLSEEGTAATAVTRKLPKVEETAENIEEVIFKIQSEEEDTGKLSRVEETAENIEEISLVKLQNREIVRGSSSEEKVISEKRDKLQSDEGEKIAKKQKPIHEKTQRIQTCNTTKVVVGEDVQMPQSSSISSEQDGKPQSKSASSTRRRRIAIKGRLSKSSSSSSGKYPDVAVMQDCFSAVKKLDGLWHAYNKVLMNCMELRRERISLLEENEQLKGIMRSVLEEAVLQKISVQLELRSNERFIRNIHSADNQIFRAYNVKILE